MEDKELIQTVSLFCNVIKKYGKRKVMRVVNKLQTDRLSEKINYIIEEIISNSCDLYKIDKSELFRDKISSDAVIVRDICIYLLIKYTSLSNRSIADIFKLKRSSNISDVKARIVLKNDKLKQDQFFLENLDIVSEIINLKIKSL